MEQSQIVQNTKTIIQQQLIPQCKLLQITKKYNVATLNFSGICLSPFEYHDLSQQKNLLSSLFGRIMKKHKLNEGFQWNTGKLDQKLQKQRYTPIYRKDVCVVDGKLINQQKFEKLWHQALNAHMNLFGTSLPTEKHISQMKEFDWIAYETFVNFLYGKQEFIDMENLQSYNPVDFQNFLNGWHSKTYLDNSKKMKLVSQLLNNQQSFDVLFLQEAETRQSIKWEDIIPQNYNIQSRQNSQSLVIYKKQTFPSNIKQNDEFIKKNFDLLKFHDASYVYTTNNFFLLAEHLSSKQEIAKSEALNLHKQLSELRKANNQLKIICGIDANIYLKENQWNQNNQQFHIFPHSHQFTTLKKRTIMQVQSRKVDKEVIETKDHIISTKKTIEGQAWINTINKQPASKDLFLPNDNHPFDHYLVNVILDGSS